MMPNIFIVSYTQQNKVLRYNILYLATIFLLKLFITFKKRFQLFL